GARTCSKKKPALRSGPRGAQSHLTARENIPRATGARRISGPLFPHKGELQQPEKYRYLQNKIRSFSITT
ncbi:hypothetical protein, partial [Faecalibacterium prausnitzii]|uniref:hypothetical protein n=1 Tax=Faecalibacterium prausnitzii TaxID=853 RepID=UPI001AD84583